MKFTNEEIALYENSIMWQSRFSRFVVRCSHAFRETVGFDLTQARILLFAAHFPSSPVGLFCQALSLRASTVSMALRSLESLGYIERVSSDVDARSVCVRVTDEGYDVFESYISAYKMIDGNMDDYLHEGGFKSICDLVTKEGFREFLMKSGNVPELVDDEVYEKLRVSRDDDPEMHLIDTSLYVEAIANLMSQLGRAWADEDLNLRTGRILSLVYIGEQRGASEVGVSHLRESLFMKPAEVSAGVMKLEEEGLAVRLRNEDDRRMTMVSLTSRGRHVAEAAMKHNLAVFEAVCPGIVNVDPEIWYKR